MKKFSLYATIHSVLLLQTLSGCAQNKLVPTSTSSPLRGWQAVPIVSAELKAKGFTGGEGAQWVRGIAVDSQSGNFMIWGTDVGGLFRSVDGGKNWEPCNVGYSPRGTAGVTIDPNNPKRVLSVGANSSASEYHGLYLSEDGASSWRQVFKANISGSSDIREQIAFDPSSYDAAMKMSKVVFWSRIKNDKPMWGEIASHPALYKSIDGGRTWAELPDSSNLGGGIVKFHPRGRAIYVGNETGLHVSRDGGKTWNISFEQNVTGLDVSQSAPNQVWLSTEKSVYVSRDSGATWQNLAGARVLAKEKASLLQIKVAPSDARRLILWRQGENWQWPRFSSHDGGTTWHESKVDGSLQILPTNARNGLFAFHPKNPNVILSAGGDYPTISRDGGKTFVWTGNGVNNILAGAFNFNAHNPDVLFVSSQDYNGASTQDGGTTWTYQNPSGTGWGGFTYGAYAVSPQTMVVGVGEGWGGTRTLTSTQDGGKTWTKSTLKYSGPEIGLGDPQDKDVAFVSNYRTQDGGRSWQPMSDCEGVFTNDGNTLYGIKGNKQTKFTSIVTSDDSGATWRVLTEVPGNIRDIAAGGGRLFFINDDTLYQWQNGQRVKIENLPNDQWGYPRVRSVAIDPRNPDNVYTASNRDIFNSSASVSGSTDGGKTWANLTANKALDGNKDGGRESFWVRVHPRTGEAWFVTGCYGIWKYVP